MIISLIHPSRGRAKKAFDTYKAWLAKASGIHVIEHLLSIDSDDPQAESYQKQYWGEYTAVICGNNTSMVGAVNRAASKAHGNIMMMLSDDFECPDKWDMDIVDALADHRDCVLKTFDGVQQWLVTLPIMDREYYLKQGYFFYPEYRHMFSDTDLTHKAELQKKLIVRNDLVFRHAHYTTKLNPKDATNVRADATWNQGEGVYLRRVRDKFGLRHVPDVLKLSPVAASQVYWIRQKLKAAA